MSSPTYRRVPIAEGGLPAPSTEPSSRGSNFFGSSGSSSSSPLSSGRLGRARIRWIILGFLGLLLLIGLLSFASDADTARTYAGKLKPSRWGSKSENPFLSSSAPLTATHGDWNDQQYDADGWVKGSGRRNLTYNSPFNRDDYSLTEDECDAFFPGLWKEIDRSVEFFTTKQK